MALVAQNKKQLRAAAAEPFLSPRPNQSFVPSFLGLTPASLKKSNKDTLATDTTLKVSHLRSAHEPERCSQKEGSLTVLRLRDIIRRKDERIRELEKRMLQQRPSLHPSSCAGSNDIESVLSLLRGEVHGLRHMLTHASTLLSETDTGPEMELEHDEKVKTEEKGPRMRRLADKLRQIAGAHQRNKTALPEDQCSFPERLRARARKSQQQDVDIVDRLAGLKTRLKKVLVNGAKRIRVLQLKTEQVELA